MGVTPSPGCQALGSLSSTFFVVSRLSLVQKPPVSQLYPHQEAKGEVGKKACISYHLLKRRCLYIPPDRSAYSPLAITIFKEGWEMKGLLTGYSDFRIKLESPTKAKGRTDNVAIAATTQSSPYLGQLTTWRQEFRPGGWLDLS